MIHKRIGKELERWGRDTRDYVGNLGYGVRRFWGVPDKKSTSHFANLYNMLRGKTDVGVGVRDIGANLIGGASGLAGMRLDKDRPGHYVGRRDFPEDLD